MLKKKGLQLNLCQLSTVCQHIHLFCSMMWKNISHISLLKMSWHWVPPERWKNPKWNKAKTPAFPEWDSYHTLCHRILISFAVYHFCTWGREMAAHFQVSRSMAWLTKKAFGMRCGNQAGHHVFSILPKRVDQARVALPFPSSNGSVFICVCIQRSGLPLKWCRKVIGLHRLLWEGEERWAGGGGGNIASQHLKSHDYA